MTGGPNGFENDCTQIVASDATTSGAGYRQRATPIGSEFFELNRPAVGPVFEVGGPRGDGLAAFVGFEVALAAARLRVASPDPRYAAKSQYLRRLQRLARRGQIHLYYEDEMDVALLPTISGRWMRMGQQTQVNTPGVNAKQYVFGATHAVSGDMVWLVWPNKNNVGFRELLKVLLAQHAQDPVKIVLVLDNYRIHKAKAVQALLGQFKKLMRFYFLPTYAPQLNPIERIWRHFRSNVTDNVFFKTLRLLLKAAKSFLTELATKPKIVLNIIVA